MTNDFSYRVSLVFALILHLALIFLLFAKFSYVESKPGLIVTGDFINAIAVDERNFKKRAPKPKPVVAKKVKKKLVAKKPVKKKVATKKIPAKKKVLVKKATEVSKAQKQQKDIAEQNKREMQKILDEEILAEKKQLMEGLHEAQSEIMAGHVDKHSALIKQAIDLQWIKPDGTNNKDACSLLVKIAPDGEVISVQLLDTTHNNALERSAKAAVLKASPLPVPEDTRLFNKFRAIKLSFKPDGVSG